MKNISKFQKKILGWYQIAKRDLPWRRTKDPYKILVSEIMLQQTQVDTVIPYYHRWLKRFPDFEKLAAAEEAVVLKHWQGLGYYRRAKMLHRNAQQVCAQHAGKLPQDAQALLGLPGIGRYTAGAVGSIAFGLKVPLLDGNVIRILTRLFAISKNVEREWHSVCRAEIDTTWKRRNGRAWLSAFFLSRRSAHLSLLGAKTI